MVKKYFQMIGIISLACFSFIFTEKTALVVRNSDELMKTIKEQSNIYEVQSVNAEIKDDTIVPGVTGKKVNSSRSYKNMKRLGKFNEKLLIYDLILPDVSITRTYDKYIVKGNAKRNMVSIIFKVKTNTKVNDVESVLSHSNKYNLFLDGKWVEKNEKFLKTLEGNNYNFGNMGYNGNYLDSGYIWVNSVINRYSTQRNSYCYVEEKKEADLKICAKEKSYTILPSIIVKENPLIEIKEKISAGDIISLDINDKTIKELPLINSYINSKGYSIVTLDELLDENI